MRQDHPDPGAAGRNHSLSQDPICQPFRRHHRHPGRIRREQISRPGRWRCIPTRPTWWGCCSARRSRIPSIPRAWRPAPTREVIGIVTQIDQPRANPAQAEAWLRLAGCETVFHVSAASGDGVWRILEYLRQEGTFCRGTTREPGEPGRRPGSFFCHPAYILRKCRQPMRILPVFPGRPLHDFAISLLKRLE